MSVPPESPTPALDDVSPTQASGRKRCENCGKWIILDGKNPANDKKRRFCKGEKCKNEFNRFGSAWGPLKTKLEGMIRTESKAAAAKAVAPQLAELVKAGEFRELLAESMLNATVFHDAMRAAGFVTHSELDARLKTLANRIRGTIRRALVLPTSKTKRAPKPQAPRPTRSRSRPARTAKRR